MNKKYLAAAVALTLSPAFAQSSATLYGVIDTAVQHQTNATPTGGTLNAMGSGSISGSRWGVKGAEDLGGGLKTVYTLEAGFNPTNGSAGQGGLAFGRQAFVGMEGDFGRLTGGRQYSVGAEHDFNFDPLWGISNVNESTFYLSYYGNQGSTFRVNNSVRYSKGFGGLNVAAMYGFGNVASSSSASAYSGVQASYTTGALNLGAAYQQTDLNTSASTNLGSTKNTKLSGNYGFGPARVFVNYMDTKVGNNGGKSDVTNLGLNYEITPLVNLVAAYYYDKTSTAASVNGSRSTTALGLSYSFSKRTMVYAYVDSSHENAGYAAFAIPAGSDIFGSAATVSSRSNVMFGIRHAF